MADVTAQLIWYRLKESYGNIAQSYEAFIEGYQDFSWRRVDILDLLFLGWIFIALFIVGLLNLYIKVYGAPCRPPRRPDRLHSASIQTSHFNDGESAVWLNSLFVYLYGRWNGFPNFVEELTKALTDEAKNFVVST